MANSKRKPGSTGSGSSWGEKKLEFIDLNTSKEDKEEISKRLAAGQITIEHFSQIVNKGGWVKFSYSVTDDYWRCMVGYTEKGEYDVLGVYVFRARNLSNAIGLAVWHSEEFSARDFVTTDDDTF